VTREDVGIAMDDGARLAATLYRPAGDPATVRFTADAERFGLTVTVPAAVGDVAPAARTWERSLPRRLA
jgi:hypothetical protein